MQKGKKSYTRNRKASRKTKRRQTRSSKRTYRNKRGGSDDSMRLVAADPDQLYQVKQLLDTWKAGKPKWIQEEVYKHIDDGLLENKLPVFVMDKLRRGELIMPPHDGSDILDNLPRSVEGLP